MLRKRLNEDVERHQIVLFRGDLDRLRELYPEASGSHIIRTLVRKLIRQAEAKKDQIQSETQESNPNVPDFDLD